MTTITFENGTKVNFQGNPTPRDIDEVAEKLNIRPDNFEQSLVRNYDQRRLELGKDITEGVHPVLALSKASTQLAGDALVKIASLPFEKIPIFNKLPPIAQGVVVGGITAGIPGAIIGGVSAYGLQKGFEKSAEIKQSPGYQQFIKESPNLGALIETGTGIVKTGIGATGVAGITKGAQAIGTKKITTGTKQVSIAPFAKSYQPELAAEFKQAGIQPPLSAISKSKIIQQAEALTSKGLFGGKIIQQINEARNKLNLKSEEISKRIEPEAVLTQEKLGNTVKEGIKEYDTSFRKTQNKIYDSFLETNASKTAVLDNTITTLGEIISGGEKSLLGGDVSLFKKLLSKVEESFAPELTENIKITLEELKASRPGKRTAIKGADGMTEKFISEPSTFPDWVPERLRSTSIFDQVIKLFEKNKEPKPNTKASELYDIVKSKTSEIKVEELFDGEQQAPSLKSNLTFDNLKKTRTEVGEALSRNPEKSSLRRLYGALTKDMDATVSIHDQGLGTELTKITENYKIGKQKIESKLISSIERSNPEKIATNLFRRNSVEALKTLKEMIGLERFNEISKAYLRKTLQSSLDRNGKLSVEKLRKNLDKLDKPTLNEIISPKQKIVLEKAIKELTQNEKLIKAIQQGIKVSEGSQTAFLNRLTLGGAEFATLISSLASGNWSIAMGILFHYGLDWGATKMFTTQAGRKFLTEGVKVPIPIISVEQSNR